MEKRILEVTSTLSKLAIEAKNHFGKLLPAQLNWKPTERSWSVAQCFDHLITTHSLYFPLFQKLESGTVTPSFWERNSPFSGFFGRSLIRSLSPENQKKMKTSSKAQPSVSEIDGRIIEHYCKHQDQLVNHLQKIPLDINPVKTIVTSPLLGFITYSLDDCFTILVVHGQRHFGQAKRVMDMDRFPG